MSQKEKEILKVLQSDFPIIENPYQVLAKRLGISPKQLLLKIEKFKQNKTIRRIGAVASAAHLGYKSMLIAARVKPESVEKTAAFINSFENVTHNYLRKAEYNLWFTYSAKTSKQINSFIAKIKKLKGVEEVLVLPATQTFKIKAEFKF
ncbi:MAG: Lrp/AsnC family transcriptional regulator [Candidatus Omnitrophica bacterium]|nr:Lrp/AsnC family transcriptional regulator [Candidatus Omnitrophota bacterium]